MTHYRKALGAAVLMLTTASLNAAPFSAIRIGDVDGFGFTTDVPLLKAANGSPVDTNGNGVIGIGEFLPDIPRLNANRGPDYVAGGDGVLSLTFQPNPPNGPIVGFDDFDNRTSADVTDTNLGGSGYTDTGTKGGKFTDLSLSASFGAVRIYSSPGSFTFPGTAPPFPFPDGTPFALPNEPSFEFRFDVRKSDIDQLQQVFFNMLIGDYDVFPASIQLVLNNGSGGAGTPVVLPLTVQAPGDDGLVQGAFATLSFFDVFSSDSLDDTVWNGFLNVRVIAPREPFLAFDYVELSTQPIFRTPAPAALPLLLLGLAAAALRRRRPTH